VVVRWKGEPVEFGRRLGWEARRGGLGRAKETLVVGDGSKWIWNMTTDRWPHARQLLDFFHGSEHLNQLAEAYCHGEATAKAWSEKHLHQLRHGQEQVALKTIAALNEPPGEAKEVVRKEKNYFANQSGRMNYKEIADHGWPIGSGPVESACRQSQCRFKCCGQFWTDGGFRHLSALDEARRNDHWDDIWGQRLVGGCVKMRPFLRGNLLDSFAPRAYEVRLNLFSDSFSDIVLYLSRPAGEPFTAGRMDSGTDWRGGVELMTAVPTLR
jgi:hypothetical protein